MKTTITLTYKPNNIIHIECKEAKISQDFKAEDVGGLIKDLPGLID